VRRGHGLFSPSYAVCIRWAFRTGQSSTRGPSYEIHEIVATCEGALESYLDSTKQ
jgi:hypothetical protein